MLVICILPIWLNRESIFLPNAAHLEAMQNGPVGTRSRNSGLVLPRLGREGPRIEWPWQIPIRPPVGALTALLCSPGPSACLPQLWSLRVSQSPRVPFTVVYWACLDPGERIASYFSTKRHSEQV